jgi:hypothetical protein
LRNIGIRDNANVGPQHPRAHRHGGRATYEKKPHKIIGVFAFSHNAGLDPIA